MKREQCPACAKNGKDRSGDNMVRYPDGGGHCFSCGHHEYPGFNPLERKDVRVREEKEITLPGDFTQRLPPAAAKWLLQWGLPLRYWEAYCGYSEKDNRVIFIYGNPAIYAQGRTLTLGEIKWRSYGGRPSRFEVVGEGVFDRIVLVEDIISAHKVGQFAPTVPLFGTNIPDTLVKMLKDKGKRVVLWLDNDQFGQKLITKINKLKLAGLDVSYISTKEDPKELSLQAIEHELTLLEIQPV